MNDLLNARIKILRILKDHGSSLRELEHELHLPSNQVVHHLDSLSQLGFIEKKVEEENTKYIIVEANRNKVDSLIQQYN
ncbi:winged helix-turn-helix transcriptional regulator [Candidatus Dojkabacteria bacterium]|nr:winged helix-turn-helix transcriptional regulator [Candidatus Dojkabacteria bacterium]